jgi:hypothetical protein
MRGVAALLVGVIAVACAETRRTADLKCGSLGELCPAPPDSALVEAITTAWLIELDPLFPTRGPMMIGPGGDSVWTVAVYERLKVYRPEFFVLPLDTAHAPHLTGITVEMLGDTARVTTSVSQCIDRQTTFNWKESGLAHKFIPFQGKWALLPGSLAHVADGKC